MIKPAQYHFTSDVYEDGVNYVYNMMIDYEKVVTEHDVMPLKEFLCGWHVIPADAFGYLSEGDIVYDCVGNKFVIKDDVWEDSDGNFAVYATFVRPDGELEPAQDIFVGGDLYYKPFYHDASVLKPKKSKGEKTICPILITSQAQPQS